MAIAVAFLIFAGALAGALWTIYATVAARHEVIAALLRGEPDPRFAAQPAVRVLSRPSPVRVRYHPAAATARSPEWRAAA